MVIINDIYAFLNEIAPVRYQMDFDNAGFLVGDGSAAVERVLLALDITDEVIAEAAALHAQLIVSHHRLMFAPLRRATSRSTARFCTRRFSSMIKQGVGRSVNLISVHQHRLVGVPDGGVKIFGRQNQFHFNHSFDL